MRALCGPGAQAFGSRAPVLTDGWGPERVPILRVAHEAVGTSDDDVTGGRVSEVELLDHLERS